MKVIKNNCITFNAEDALKVAISSKINNVIGIEERYKVFGNEYTDAFQRFLSAIQNHDYDDEPKIAMTVTEAKKLISLIRDKYPDYLRYSPRHFIEETGGRASSFYSLLEAIAAAGREEKNK